MLIIFLFFILCVLYVYHNKSYIYASPYTPSSTPRYVRSSLITNLSDIPSRKAVNVYVHGPTLANVFENTNCQFTKRLVNADVVLFNMRTNNLPYIETQANHVLIFYQSESPIYSEQSAKLPFFHGGISYSRSSLVYDPYGWIQDSRGNSSDPRPSFSDKKYIALWFVSHCGANSKRDSVARALVSEVSSVHIFGDCGEKAPCSRRLKKKNRNRYANCINNLTRNYMFYLSFENSQCEDYITEKFYSALMRGLIPVALGGKHGREDYRSLGIPDSAYIHIADFSDIQKLGRYLMSVFKNETKYNYHHRWRNTHTVISPAGFSYNERSVRNQLSRTICDPNFIKHIKTKPPQLSFTKIWGKAMCK